MFSLRTNPEERELWQRAAGDGVPLSRWVRRVLNQAARDQLGLGPNKAVVVKKEKKT